MPLASFRQLVCCLKENGCCLLVLVTKLLSTRAKMKALSHNEERGECFKIRKCFWLAWEKEYTEWQCCVWMCNFHDVDIAGSLWVLWFFMVGLQQWNIFCVKVLMFVRETGPQPAWKQLWVKHQENFLLMHILCPHRITGQRWDKSGASNLVLATQKLGFYLGSNLLAQLEGTFHFL